MTIGVILVIIAAGELILGLWFLTRRSRNQTMLWYGLFAISSAVYVGSNGLGFILDVGFGRMAENFGWAGGALATACYLPFSYSFPIPRRPIRELLILVIWPVLIFVPGFLFSNAFLAQERIVSFGTGYQTVEGPYFWLFIIFLAVYWGWSIGNHIRVFVRGDGATRGNVGIILVGTLLSLIVTMYFDVLKPITAVSTLGYVGSLMTTFWLGSALYVLLKK